MSYKYKSCPFCGNCHIREALRNQCQMILYCSECGCEGPKIDYPDESYPGWQRDVGEKAIEAWNTRRG